MKKLLTIMLCFQVLAVSAQREYLVKVNPGNGNFSEIAYLPGVNWISVTPAYIAFDERNHRYLFRGSTDATNWNLYSVDVLTGSIITQVPFPVLADKDDNVIELEYDNAAGKLYGLHWSNAEQKEYLVVIDPASGAFTRVGNSLPGVKFISLGHTAFDKQHHHFIFRGIDNNDESRLYTVDAQTGDVLSNPLFPVLSDPYDNLGRVQYDNSSNTLYGLHWDNSEEKEYLVSVDPQTGSFTKINSLPGVKAIVISPNYTTFDETRRHYIFRGLDDNSIVRLYSVDVQTGNIVSSPVFPVLAHTDDNVIELKCDNTSGILYALHWKTGQGSGLGNNTKKTIAIFPNPCITSTTVMLDRVYNKLDYILYNVSGRVVEKKTSARASTISLQRGQLAAGVYFISVIGDEEELGLKKLVIE